MDKGRPLIQDRGWRAMIAFGIAVIGCLVALIGAAVLFVLGVPSGLDVAVGVLCVVCGVLAAWAVEAGGWRRGPIGHVQRVAVVFGLLWSVAVLAAGTARGVGLLLELPAYGTPPSAAVPSLGAAAVGAAALALLLAAAPLAGTPAFLSPPRLRRMVSGAAIVGGIAAVGAVATAAAPAGCAMFEFRAERWRSEMAGAGGARLVRMGEAVQRCGIVEAGMTRSQVRGLLGKPSSAVSGTYTWPLGDDGLLNWLVVDFRRQDGIPRVSDIMLVSD